MLCRAENSSEGRRSHSIDLDAPVTVWRRTIAPQSNPACPCRGECDTDGKASPSPLSLMSGCGCCRRSHREFEEENVLYATNGGLRGGHWLRRDENFVVYSCCGEGGKPGRLLRPAGGREHGAAGESGWSVPFRLRQDKKFLPCTMFAIFPSPLRSIFSSTSALRPPIRPQDLLPPVGRRFPLGGACRNGRWCDTHPHASFVRACLSTQLVDVRTHRLSVQHEWPFCEAGRWSLRPRHWRLGALARNTSPPCLNSPIS